MILGEQIRPQGCITDLRFDAWYAGEISGAAREAFDLHVASCRRCQKRQSELAAEREAFLAINPRLVKPPWRTPPERRKRWAMATMTIAASAAALIALYIRPNFTEISQTVRLKGGAHIGFFVQRGDMYERATPVYTVHPEDRVRFIYSSPRPAYLAIYGVDTRGTVSVYFPASDSSERVRAGSDVALKSAVELDEVLGLERIYALFCQSAFQIAEPKNKLAAQQMLEPVPGCHVDTLTWNKEARRE